MYLSKKSCTFTPIGSFLAIRDLRLILLHTLWKSPWNVSEMCKLSSYIWTRLTTFVFVVPSICTMPVIFTVTPAEIQSLFLASLKYPVKITSDEAIPAQTQRPQGCWQTSSLPKHMVESHLLKLHLKVQKHSVSPQTEITVLALVHLCVCGFFHPLQLCCLLLFKGVKIKFWN